MITTLCPIMCWTPQTINRAEYLRSRRAQASRYSRFTNPRGSRRVSPFLPCRSQAVGAIAMAAECRAFAERAITETVREQLMEMADQFERLPEHRLKTRRPMPGH